MWEKARIAMSNEELFMLADANEYDVIFNEFSTRVLGREFFEDCLFFGQSNEDIARDMGWMEGEELPEE